MMSLLVLENGVANNVAMLQTNNEHIGVVVRMSIMDTKSGRFEPSINMFSP